MAFAAFLIGVLKLYWIGTFTVTLLEKLIIATRSMASSKRSINVLTAGGSAVEPPLLLIDPERSSTSDITSFARVAWALAATSMVFQRGRIRMKKVLIVAVALTVNSVLLLASVLKATLTTGGPLSRPEAP